MLIGSLPAQSLNYFLFTLLHSIAWEISSVHTQQVLDIDFNPNLPYTLASAGDDCTIKFWDYKKPSEPVEIMQLSSHSHW